MRPMIAVLVVVAVATARTAMRSEPIDISGTKIHRAGTLIGKALEPLQSGEGEILILLSLQYRSARSGAHGAREAMHILDNRCFAYCNGFAGSERCSGCGPVGQHHTVENHRGRVTPGAEVLFYGPSRSPLDHG